jgi:hypothetical protein
MPTMMRSAFIKSSIAVLSFTVSMSETTLDGSSNFDQDFHLPLQPERDRSPPLTRCFYPPLPWRTHVTADIASSRNNILHIRRTIRAKWYPTAINRTLPVCTSNATSVVKCGRKVATLGRPFHVDQVQISVYHHHAIVLPWRNRHSSR